jgi:AcrR family transcriptional regulator
MLNKPRRNVRKGGEDRRVLRTRRALGTALVELMLAHNFDDITVQQILDRARVGRATFYTHFRNKHDLLLSDAERYFEWLERQFLETAGTSRRLAPVAELFSHVVEYQHFRHALEKSSMREPAFDLLTGYLAQIIQRRMGEIYTVTPSAGLPPNAMARMFAAALVEMMRWWLIHRPDANAREMDARFHSIVWAGLARTAPHLPRPDSA